MLAGNCHVADSNVTVIRYVRGAMKEQHRNDTSPAVRDLRKQVYRDALRAHADNQRMYYDIARGNIGS